MPLTFPTQAEQTLSAFRNTTRTVALSTLAQRAGAQVYHRGPITEYVFPDDTSLTVRGRGKSHEVEVHLP